MRNRPLFLFGLSCLAFAMTVTAWHVPAQQPGATPIVVAIAQPGGKEVPPAAIKIAPSKVTNVTVYATSALVTREVEAAGPAGRVELVVSPLPPTTIPSSLYAEGSEGIRV